MYRIIDSRSSGKTGRLMLLAKEQGAAIVCSHPRAMEQKARAYGITGIDFIGYADFLINKKNEDIGKYLIDELESFITYVQYNCNIKGEFNGYTISQE